MTSSEIRIAVAKALGWEKKPVDDGWTFSNPSMPAKVERWVFKNKYFVIHLPEFTESLDACAEFEKTLTGSSDDEESERTKYGEALCWVIYETDEPNAVYSVDIATATPIQRCIAFLKVKGLWNEA